jgi:hypothetical protein
MALTRPRIQQFDTTISSIGDPVTVLKAGIAQANVDIGFLMNRSNGLVSNVGLYWSESSQQLVTAYTSSDGSGYSNIAVSSYAPVAHGNAYVISNTASAATWTTSNILGYQITQGINAGLGSLGIGFGTNSSVGSFMSISASGGKNFISTAYRDFYIQDGSSTQWFYLTTANGNITLNSTTTSANTTSGALVVKGGVGIGGNLNVAGNATISNAISIGTATWATSGGTVTDAAVVMPFGQWGIYANVSTGGLVYSRAVLAKDSSNNIVIGSTLGTGMFGNVNVYPGSATNAGSFNIYHGAATSIPLLGVNSTANTVVISNNQTASSTTTGALIVAGGMGIAGTIYGGSGMTIGGNDINFVNVGTSINLGTTQVAGAITAGGTSQTGTITLGQSTASQTVTIAGGATASGSTKSVYFAANGTAGSQTNIVVGSTVGASNLYIAAATPVIVANNTASSSTTTGALVLSGGLGLTGSVYASGLGSFASGLKTATLTSTQTTVNLYADGTQTTVNLGTTGATVNLPVTSITGTATITGNTDVQNTLYGRGVYDNGIRVVSTSSGGGNLTISGGAINLPMMGPGAVVIGGSTSIPVITMDAYGRVAGLSTASISTTLSTSGTSGTGSIALANQTLQFAGSYGVTATAASQTITIATPQDLQTSASPTFATLTTTGNAYINGTLFVANLQARGSVNAIVQDPMLYLQANVLYPWIYDTGIYSDSIGGPANTYVHHGLVRSNDFGYWGFFSNVKSEPSATINWGDAGLIWDTVKTGDIVVANTTTSTSTVTGALRVAGGAGIAGNVYADKVYTTTGLYWSGNGYAFSSGGATPAGALGQMQFNNSGALGATNMYYWAGNSTITSGTIYSSALYDNSVRVVSTSSGAGNLTISSGAINLTAVGPGATTVGSSTAIPVITTDVYGRITALTSSSVSTTINLAGTSGTGSVAGGGTLTFAGTNGVTATASSSTITVSTPQDLQTSASPTFAGGNFTGNVTRSSRTIVTNYSGNVAPASPLMGDEWFRGNTGVMYKYLYDNVSSTYNWINISSALYNASTSATASTLALRDTGGNLTATNFLGTASSAKYADLAEIYTSDKNYEPGTVVVFGGTAEITVTKKTHDTRVAGVISTNPAYLMNSEAVGLPVAFTGRVPCKVRGPVAKGDVLVTSAYAEYAERMTDTLYRPGCILGKSLSDVAENEFATVEVVVGRF